MTAKEIAGREPASYAMQLQILFSWSTEWVVTAYDSNQCNFWDARDWLADDSCSPKFRIIPTSRALFWLPDVGPQHPCYGTQCRNILVAVCWLATQRGGCIIALVIAYTAATQYQMSVRVTISCRGAAEEQEEYERSRFSTQRSRLRPRQPLLLSAPWRALQNPKSFPWWRNWKTIEAQDLQESQELQLQEIQRKNKCKG